MIQIICLHIISFFRKVFFFPTQLIFRLAINYQSLSSLPLIRIREWASKLANYASLPDRMNNMANGNEQSILKIPSQ